MSDQKNKEIRDTKSVLEMLADERSRSSYYHNKTVVTQIQSMYESGETVLKITQLFGVSANYVHVTAKRKGWKRPSWYKWKFRPASAANPAEAPKKKKNKEEVVVVERSDPSMLALFDKYQAQIDEQNDQLTALKETCDTFNRLEMIKEVYEELDDKEVIFTETMSSLQTEVRALQKLNDSYIKEVSNLKEQLKLVTPQLKDLLASEQKLSNEAEKDKKTIFELKQRVKALTAELKATEEKLQQEKEEKEKLEKAKAEEVTEPKISGPETVEHPRRSKNS